MNIFKRFITIICLTAFLICLSGVVKAKADAIEASEVISNIVTGADLTSISYAYNNLSSQQKYIADYLLGAYNYAYLCARGFSFNIDQTETNMKAQLGSIGNRVWQYITTEYGWRSRFNEVFRQYASSIIVYASKINISFSDWIDEILAGTRNVYIEYSEDAFDAWTVFYNDPSGDGIASFGDVISNWNSGTLMDFDFVGIPWSSSSEEALYNNYILNNSPVIYTNTIFNQVVGMKYQVMFNPLINGNLIDSLFVLRSSSNQFNSYRYGYSDISLPGNYTINGVMIINQFYANIVGATNGTFSFSPSIYTENVTYSLADLVQLAFNRTPFYNSVYWSNNYFTLYYPFIEHVYLVDDLNTLSNPEEVFNVDSFNIIPSGMSDYILTPNGKMLIPGYAPLNDPFADIWDVSVDINNNPSTEDDYHTQIVNNTVINNYIVDDNDKINVPVQWFDNEYTDQLHYDAQPFFTFVRDCIQSLGDLQIYFYGAIVVGLGGGILKKFLL